MVVLVAIATAAAILWQPVLRPASKAAVILLDVYSTSLTGTDWAGLVTPEPRVVETRETFAGVTMRVTWWRPGWGDRHPAMLLVNGATPSGNDLPETRLISGALARAGFLVMLPQIPSLTEDRFDPAAVDQVDAAFAVLLAHPARSGRSGAYGFSVGGGLLLAAAGQGPALRRADYLGVLGAYFDLDQYIASVVSGLQARAAGLEPWKMSDDLPLRGRLATTGVLADGDDRRRLADELRETKGALRGEPAAPLGTEAAALRHALTATDHPEALRRLEALPQPVRDRLARLSPRAQWAGISAPVYWLHDAADHYVPVAQGESAARAATGPLRLVTPGLIAHGQPIRKDGPGSGPLFWASELWRLLDFTMDVLRVAT